MIHVLISIALKFRMVNTLQIEEKMKTIVKQITPTCTLITP